MLFAILCVLFGMILIQVFGAIFAPSSGFVSATEPRQWRGSRHQDIELEVLRASGTLTRLHLWGSLEDYRLNWWTLQPRTDRAKRKLPYPPCPIEWGSYTPFEDNKSSIWDVKPESEPKPKKLMLEVVEEQPQAIKARPAPQKRGAGKPKRRKPDLFDEPGQGLVRRVDRGRPWVPKPKAEVPKAQPKVEAKAVQIPGFTGPRLPLWRQDQLAQGFYHPVTRVYGFMGPRLQKEGAADRQLKELARWRKGQAPAPQQESAHLMGTPLFLGMALQTLGVSPVFAIAVALGVVVLGTLRAYTITIEVENQEEEDAVLHLLTSVLKDGGFQGRGKVTRKTVTKAASPIPTPKAKTPKASKVMGHFTHGDQVVLKSGGPVMTVLGAGKSGIKCGWPVRGKYREGDFPVLSLKKFQSHYKKSQLIAAPLFLSLVVQNLGLDPLIGVLALSFLVLGTIFVQDEEEEVPFLDEGEDVEIPFGDDHIPFVVTSPVFFAVLASQLGGGFEGPILTLGLGLLILGTLVASPSQKKESPMTRGDKIRKVLSDVSEQKGGLNSWMLKKLQAAKTEPQKKALLQTIYALWMVSYGTDLALLSKIWTEDHADLEARYSEAKGAQAEALRLILSWDIDQLDLDWNALREYAIEEGLILTLAQEMANCHATCPMSELSDPNRIWVATSYYAAWILRRCDGYVSYIHLGDSRHIFAEVGLELWPGVSVFGDSKYVSRVKAEKGKKYAKSFFAPMASQAVVRVKKEHVLIVPEVTDVPQAVIDGQVLIAVSLFEKLMTSEQARKAFSKKAGDERRKWYFRTFIGRLHVPELGLIKGGFVVVPDQFLNFGGKQYAIAASEVKVELVLRKGQPTILCASSNLKKLKTATTDLQNFLMSLPVTDIRFEQLVQVLIAEHAKKFEDRGQSRVAELDALAQEGEIEDTLSELQVAKALLAAGYDISCIPQLYVAVMNLAGDNEFDPARFRLQGKVGNLAWRESIYIQAHPGRSILALEAKLGALKITDESRRWLQSWEQMGDFELMTNTRLAEKDGGQTFITRRPQSLGDGMSMTMKADPWLDQFSPTMWLKPVINTVKEFFGNLNGADLDDSFESNSGLFRILAEAWSKVKAGFFNAIGHGYDALLDSLNNAMGGSKVFGLTLSDWQYASSKGCTDDECEELRVQAKNSHLLAEGILGWKDGRRPPYLTKIQKVRSQFTTVKEVNPIDSWTKKSVLDDGEYAISAWTGTAANAQMFATFVLQGMILKNNEQAQEVAKVITSVMLSDIIDATTKGDNVDKAAESMTILCLGTLCLAHLLLQEEKPQLPQLGVDRAVWFVKNELKDRFVDTDKWIHVGWRWAKEKLNVGPIMAYEVMPWAPYDNLKAHLEWCANKVASDILHGQELGEASSLAAQAVAEYEEISNQSASLQVRREIRAAQIKSSNRRQIAARSEWDEDDLMMNWVSAPYRQSLESLETQPEANVYGVTLVAIGELAKLGEDAPIECSVDQETKKFRLSGAGSNLVITGVVGETFAAWLSEHPKGERLEQLSFFKAEKDENGKNVYQGIIAPESYVGMTLGQIQQMGFSLVYKGEGETSFSRTINKNRKVLLPKYDSCVIIAAEVVKAQKLNSLLVVTVDINGGPSGDPEPTEDIDPQENMDTVEVPCVPAELINEPVEEEIEMEVKEEQPQPEVKNVPKVTIYTDGACSGNPGPGGWGCILTMGNREKEIGGHMELTTNVKMEMSAVIEGLNALKVPADVTIVTDFKLLIEGAEKWLEGWKANGWKKADKSEVKNINFWKSLDAAMSRHNSITWEWVKGHSGHPMNERVDKLAVHYRDLESTDEEFGFLSAWEAEYAEEEKNTFSPSNPRYGWSAHS